MPRNQKTRSSGLTAVVVITKNKPNGHVLGFVEQFSVTQSLRSEIIYSVGSQKGRENVIHGVDRVDISWGSTRTLKEDEAVALGVSPSDNELPDFEPITVRYLDFDRGEIICQVDGVQPSSVGISTGAMAKISENWSGSGIQVLWGSEMNN